MKYSNLAAGVVENEMLVKYVSIGNKKSSHYQEFENFVNKPAKTVPSTVKN